MTDRKFIQFRGLRPVKFNTVPIPTGATTRPDTVRDTTHGNFERYQNHKFIGMRVTNTAGVINSGFNINTKN